MQIFSNFSLYLIKEALQTKTNLIFAATIARATLKNTFGIIGHISFFVGLLKVSFASSMRVNRYSV